MAKEGLEDPLVTFRLLEALRTDDIDALENVITALPPDTGNTAPQQNTSSSSSSTHSTAEKQTPANNGHLSPLHLAIQVSSPKTVSYLLNRYDVNVINGKTAKGDTPLHLAAKAGRTEIVEVLLKDHRVNDGAKNSDGKMPEDLATSKALSHLIRSNRQSFLEGQTISMHRHAHSGDFEKLQQLLTDPRTASSIDINHQDPIGGLTILHEASQRGQIEVVEWLLEHEADVFVRDRRGKLPIDLTKEEKVKAIIKRFTKGVDPSDVATYTSPDQAPKMQGFLQKWTNFAKGYKLRWFVLENGILSYYKNQQDTDNGCRGSLSLRIARLVFDTSDPLRIDLTGKGSFKLNLRADHIVDAKRWIFAITQSKEWLSARGDRGHGSVRPTRHSRAHDSHGSDDDEALHERRNSFSTSSLQLDEHYSGESRRESRSAPDTRADPTAGRSRSPSPESGDRTPHSSTFPTAVSSVQAHVDMQIRLLTSLSEEVAPIKEDDGASEKRQELIKASLTSATALRKVFGDLAVMTEDREVYWKTKFESESEKQNLWAESLRQLASENHLMQQEVKRDDEKLQTLQRNITKQRKPAPGPVSTGADAVNKTVDTTTHVIADILKNDDEKSEDYEDPEDEEEFFDAIEDVLQATGRRNPTDSRKSVKAQQEDVDAETLASNASQATATTTSETAVSVRGARPLAKEVYRLPGYPSGDAVRQWLPLPSGKSAPEMSLWSVIKSSIGKDLSKITLPVFFNEPISMLQRMCEDMEYSELLTKAAAQEGSAERLLYVAAFAMSNYSSTVGRTGKPFNPLLGETYELSMHDKGFRYVSEQVSHHPPISACHGESPDYQFFAEVYVKSKFCGKYLEVHPLGVSHVNLKIPQAWAPVNSSSAPSSPSFDTGEHDSSSSSRAADQDYSSPKFLEHYSYKKVTTCVNNLIIGKLTVDHYGEMVIKNHSTGDTATLNFRARGWRDKTPCEIKGEIRSAEGVVMWEIWGRWDDKLIARKPTSATQPPLGDTPSSSLLEATSLSMPPVSSSAAVPPTSQSSSLHPPGTLNNRKIRPVLLWRRNPMPPKTPFNLTPFAMALNDTPDDLKRYLCPTDCRMRPDQHAMEHGEWDRADEEKNRLEVKQRNKRKERELRSASDGGAGGGDDVHKARWFSKTVDPDSNENYWKFDPEYWVRRQRVVDAVAADAADADSVGNGGKEGVDVEAVRREVWKDVDEIY